MVIGGLLFDLAFCFKICSKVCKQDLFEARRWKRNVQGTQLQRVQLASSERLVKIWRVDVTCCCHGACPLYNLHHSVLCIVSGYNEQFHTESWFISIDFHHSCFVCHTAGTWSVLLLTTSHILRIRHWLMIPGMGCRSSTTQPTLTLRLWTRWPREPSSSLAARFGSLVVYVGGVVSRYEDSYANLLCLKPCVFPCFPLFLFSK